MKVQVCGGGDFDDYGKVRSTLDLLHRESPVSSIIHGPVGVADSLAGRWAVENSISVSEFSALWDIYGRVAARRRNLHLLAEGKPDLVLAFPGGLGTANMVYLAREAGVPTIDSDGTREQVILAHWAYAVATTEAIPPTGPRADIQSGRRGQVVHYAPGENPLCGDEDTAALCNDHPERVAGCEYCLARVSEDLTDDHFYQGTCLHCREKIIAQGGITWSRAVRRPCPHCGRAGW